MNQNIIDKLTQLASTIAKSKVPADRYRHKALSTAISNISAHTSPIKSGEQAHKDIPYVGKGIGDRIDEILRTGTLTELKNEVINPEPDPVDELTQITGVGEKRAEEWIALGIKTIPELKQAVDEGSITLTHHIAVGLKYVNDFKLRIPRHEVELAEKMIRKVLHEVNAALLMNICGSYRRGLPSSGDIDVLIANPINTDTKEYLPIIVKAMTKDGFVIDHLTEHGNKKYMGVCKIETFARRIDIRVVDYAAYYACLIYFTGSKNFNIKLRNKALELGYSLNEYGLKDKKSAKLITLHNEKELFDLLKMDYVEPTDRDI